MSSGRVLIVDDEEGVRTSLALILEGEGYRVRAAAGPDEALAIARREAFDVVLCDIRMPGRSGLEFLPELIRLQPAATALVMSAFGDVDVALEAVRAGAYDFLSKPFRAEELLLTIRKAEEREKLKSENRRLRRALGQGEGGPELVAASPGMRRVVELVEHAAAYKTTVLITGESGVGKEVVARAIHGRSARAEEPFVAVNCGAIPESLIESELFGHARGAFTGADSDRRGLFREASGGTLFLDEIGELPPPVQVKLLRVLQESEVHPVGEAKPQRVDVRIVAATARALETEIEAGRFRADLFYRLDVFRIVVPPLRERPEDLAVLADALVRRLVRRIGKPVEPPDAAVLDALRAHAWPGNVRELENTLERAIILSEGRLTPELLPFSRAAAPAVPAGEADLSVKRRTRELEERLIRHALARTGGNRTHASRLLEISARALQYKLKEYAIDPLNPLPAGSDSA